MRYTILTYIFNNYEFVREPCVIDPEAEYLLITDDKALTSKNWKIIYDERLEGLSVFDKCYYVRFHLFDYAKTDICIRLDGSIQIKDSLKPIVDRFQELKADILLMINPVHNYLLDDYEQWVETRNYPKEAADRAKKKIASLGYDESYKGYYQANFVIERNNELTQGIDNKTFHLLKELGVNGVIDRFDQPIWAFVINKYYANRIKVMTVSVYIITCSRYLQWYMHNTDKAIVCNNPIKPFYLFNKMITPERFDFFHSSKFIRAIFYAIDKLRRTFKL